VVLVDTHVVLWLAFEEDKISKNAWTAIREARRESEGLAICDMTLLELAMVAGRGRVRLKISVESFLQEVDAMFVTIPITVNACAQAIHLPSNYPKDPADRIIGATAIVNGMPLITADRAIRDAKAFPTIW
jgi:PIN domain nuclease of toxin-antitoxin system